MKKNIEVNKENSTITIEVSVNKRNYVREPIISFRTKDIILLLEKEGYEIDTCIQNDTIYNDGRNAKVVGKWVFKTKEAPKEKAKKPVIEKEPPKNNLTKNTEPAIIRKKTKKRK